MVGDTLCILERNLRKIGVNHKYEIPQQVLNFEFILEGIQIEKLIVFGIFYALEPSIMVYYY